MTDAAATEYNTDQRILEFALEYASYGIAIFPCKQNKAPLTKNGFKDATADKEQIRKWWYQWPKAMIGMPTGTATGIAVIDIDLEPDEGIDGHEFLPNWSTMSPVIAETPSGGHHLYFRSNDIVRSTTDEIAVGVDTRGRSGYVIVPPSSNAAGRYKFVTGDETCLKDPSRLPQFPADLLAKLGTRYTGRGGALVLPAGAPMAAAEAFLKHRCSDGKIPLLWSYRGLFYKWTGTHYREYADEELERDLYEFLNGALAIDKSNRPVPFNPSKNKVSYIVHALRRCCLISRDWDTPCWLGKDKYRPASNLVACRNGILNLETRKLQPHDPLFFTANCSPLDYDSAAPKPKRWLRFLEEILPPDKDGYYDAEAEETLQEIAGYLLTSDTRQQKIFLIIGPPRSGKGTVVHVLEQLLGEDNCVFPTLSSLGGEFGRWPLIDKKLAAITDARISSKADTHKIAELLLSISGGDRQTINRKNQAFWTGRLDVRFLITTNVLPAIRDASGTIATRYVLLKLTETFLGREDLNLKATLAQEMSGILNWALDGLDRLRKRGFFRTPASSQESIRELEDAAEPVRAFLREWCEQGPTQRVKVKMIYPVYRAWAEENGHTPLEKNSFGRALRGQIPKLDTTGVGAKRTYVGVALSKYGEEQFRSFCLADKGKQ